MKRSLVMGFMLISSVIAEGKYVLSADSDGQETLRWYSYIKGYVLEQEAGNLFSQKDLVFKYGIKWALTSNLSAYIDPPLIRYHYGRGISYCMGLGDMDIGATMVLLAGGIAGYGFIRIPTGAVEMPIWDEWAPKFSNNKWGGGGKLIFSQVIMPGVKAHLNIGLLANIGDLTSELIPSTRIPLGIEIALANGAFIEAETDINKYSDDIPIAKNPKRVAVGVNYEYCPEAKLLVAFEYGTWGTGDPPIHNWSYGWTEDVKQWDVTLGISSPIGLRKPTALTGIVEGRVIDNTGKPVMVKITLKSLGISTVTDEDGCYKMSLPPGKYVATIEIPGYEKAIQEAIVTCGPKPTKLNFVLTLE